jgi:hypothetical protein
MNLKTKTVGQSSPLSIYNSPVYLSELTPPTQHPQHSPASISSGRSSRSSDRSEHPYYPQHYYRSNRHHSHQRSITEYGYDSTPPSSVPSTGSIPSLSRSGTSSSVSSSQESSPALPPVRNLLPILDTGKKRLRTGGSNGGLLSRFLAGAQNHSPERLGAATMSTRSVY